MANYFVSPQGSNSNNGTTPALAWLTLTKALTTLVPASGGDTVYMAPGTYREVVTPTITPDSTHQVSVVGDFTNSQGFPSVSPGEIVLTAFLTNDTTAPSGGVTLALGAKTYLSFQYLTIYSGTTNVITATAGTGHITFTECLLVAAGSNGISVVSGADAAANWLFDRCIIVCYSGTDITIAPAAFTGGSDVDISFVVQNCLLIGRGQSSLVSFGPTAVSGAGKAYGVKCYNNTFVGGVSALAVTNANASSSNACLFYNNVCIGQAPCLSANVSGQITEDYNILAGTSVRTNVTAGTNSKLGGSSLTYALMLQWGQENWLGQGRRPFMGPAPGSPVLGFGNQSVGISVDAHNKPRPAGGGSNSAGVGWLERHNTARKETSTVDAGGVGINLVCPGDQDMQIPVNAAQTTITIKYRSDAGVTPTAQVLANGEIGVSASAVQTGTAAQGTFTVLTIPAFTPNAKGVVTLRLACTGTAGNLAYFDTLGVA